jgi:phosphoribosylformylglycinamidine synthase subunit PurS
MSDPSKKSRFRANIRVTLRTSILDPQGKAVQHALDSMGLHAATDVRIGKFIELSLDCATEEEASRLAGEACSKLLANPVMEDYSFTIERLP